MAIIKQEFGTLSGGGTVEPLTGYSAGTGISYTEVTAKKTDHLVAITGELTVTADKGQNSVIFTGLPAPISDVTVTKALQRSDDTRNFKINTNGEAILLAPSINVSTIKWAVSIVYEY